MTELYTFVHQEITLCTTRKTLAQEEALVKWALFQDDMGILKEKAEAILRLSNSSTAPCIVKL